MFLNKSLISEEDLLFILIIEEDLLLIIISEEDFSSYPWISRYGNYIK